MESTFHSRDEKSYMTQMNVLFDQYILQQPLLPQQVQQKAGLLKARWFRLLVLFYILFSVVLTAAHFSSWVVFQGSNSSRSNRLSYQRTYDPFESYSLMSNMSHGLKMSKLFSKGHYESLQHVQPYWQRAQQVPKELDVTIVTTTTPEAWKDLVNLAESWNGPISATIQLSKQEDSTIKSNIELEYKSNPTLYKNVDLHLIETTSKGVNVLIPLNVERNVARIYSRSNHVLDMPLNTILATNLRTTLIKNQFKYAQLMKKGDMIVLPTFKQTFIETNIELPQTKKELIGLVQEEKIFGLFDVNFELNQGPTDFNTWKNSKQQLYKVKRYTMDYEPIIIASKSVQPWCSERFVDKRSACLLSSYLAGNDFLVLVNDFAIVKSSGAVTTSAISDLDYVIEKRLYAKFYWEQCVYQGRQLDAMGLWNTVKADHIRQQCSRVIQNWGKGLIGKPE